MSLLYTGKPCCSPKRTGISHCRSDQPLGLAGVDPYCGRRLSLSGPLRQVSLAVIREARYGIMSGVMAAFGRVMAEVGAISSWAGTSQDTQE